MRYFIYCRKSTEAEDRQVASLESQLTTLKRTFGERPHIEIVRVYEEAFSAKAPGRPIFGEMIAEIETGKADGIIAWAPDRLARNSIDGGRIVYLLDTGAIKDLKFSTYTFENNSQGKFMLQIMFGQSKYYSDALSENVKRGNRTKLEKGWRPNLAPVGYLNDKASKTVIKDPERFTVIRRMFEEALASTPISRIRTMANEEWNFRTPLKKRIGGKPLTLSALYQIFHNPFYCGLIPWGDKVYPGAHEPVVTVDEFERVQAFIRGEGKAKPRGKEFAFTGMIHCGECGMLVTAEDKRNRFGSHYIYYHCTKRRSNYRCSQRCIRVEQLEAQIESFLATLHISEKLHDWALAQLAVAQGQRRQMDDERLRSIQKSIADAERALDTLITLRLRDLVTDEQFVSERRKIEAQKIKLRQQLEQSTDDTFEPAPLLFSFSVRAMNHFRHGNARTKRAILNSVGSNLSLTNKKLAIEAKKPLCQIASVMHFQDLCAAVEEIRKLYIARDPEFMSMLDNIRKLNVMLQTESAPTADRPAA